MRRTAITIDAPAAMEASRRVRADGYVRVSRVGGRGGESFISPEIQEERIRAYVRSRQFELGVIHHELDRSGTDSARPQLAEALQRVQRAESDGIIVARLDRLARSALDALTAIQAIADAGGVFVSVEDGFDSSTQFGRAMMTILLAFAELELARVRDNWDSAQERAIARGVHFGGPVPIGYRRGRDGRLLPDEHTSSHVLDAFRRRAAGATSAEIARLLNHNRMKDERRLADGCSIKYMLGNRAYIGEAHYGRHRNAAAHPAIVPTRLWLEAQLAAEIPYSHPASRTLLSGLIRCAACGRIMAPRRVSNPAGSAEKTRLVAYACRQHWAVPVCPAPARAAAADVERLVVDHFFAALSARRQRKRTLAMLDARLKASALYLPYPADTRALHSAAGDRGQPTVTQPEAAQEETRGLLQQLRRAAFLELPSATMLRKVWPQASLAGRRRVLAAAFDAVVIERGRPRDLEDRTQFIPAGEMASRMAHPHLLDNETS